MYDMPHGRENSILGAKIMKKKHVIKKGSIVIAAIFFMFQVIPVNGLYPTVFAMEGMDMGTSSSIPVISVTNDPASISHDPVTSSPENSTEPLSEAEEPCTAHCSPGDEFRQDEHEAMEGLMDETRNNPNAIRITQNTNFSELNLQDGDEIIIENGATLTMDVVSDVKLRTVLVDNGTLQFSTSVNSQLTVDTLFVDVLGTLNMGTETAPIADNVSAKILITAYGELDPLQIRRGLISHGVVNMYGREVEEYVMATSALMTGQNTLNLGTVPTGWQVGDQIVVQKDAASQGKNITDNGFEVFTIMAISSDGTITLDRPASMNHQLNPELNNLYIGNVTRNVIVESANPDDILERGHVMFMHSPKVSINFAAFNELGRTMANSPTVTDPAFDEDGNLIPGSDANVRGRYAVHFHRQGSQTKPAVIRGSVVNGGPGWGIVNHSSTVLIENNLVYNIIGSGIVTEAGNEFGTISENLIMNLPGGPLGPKDDVSQGTNPGSKGSGVWTEGNAVLVSDNVVIGAVTAFSTFPRPESGLGPVSADALRTAFGDPTLFANVTSVAVMDIPIRNINNTAIAVGAGFKSWFHLRGPNHDVRSLIENFTVIYGQVAIDNNYTENMDVLGLVAIGNGLNGIGMNLGTRNADYSIGNSSTRRTRIEGYAVGISGLNFGENTIKNVYFKNIFVNIQLATIGTGDTRVINIVNNEFDQWPAPVKRQSEPFYNIRFNYVPDRPEIPNATDWPAVFDVDKIYLTTGATTQQIFWEQSAADYVVFPNDADSDKWGVPEQFRHKTTQQLWDEFGLAVGGIIAPEGLTSDSLIFGGLLGEPAAYGPYIKSGNGVFGSDLGVDEQANNRGGLQLTYQLNGEYIDYNGNIQADRSPIEYLYGVSEGWTTWTRDFNINGEIVRSTSFHWIAPLNGNLRDEPQISNVSVTVSGSTATITWTTDELSDSSVQLGLDMGYGLKIVTAKPNTDTTTHSVIITGLNPDMTYHLRAVSGDETGDTGYSQDYTFSTGSYADTIAPVLGRVTVDDLTSSTAKISWTTSESTTARILYGTTNALGSEMSLGGLSLNTNHIGVLDQLASNTTFYYQVESCEGAGNCSLSTVSTFTTFASAGTPPPPPPPTGDTTPAVILGMEVSDILWGSASLGFSTDELTTTVVEYGTTTNYSLSTSGNMGSMLMMSHSVMLANLSPSTKYYYRVKVTDAAGNETFWLGDFTTIAAPPPPPPPPGDDDGDNPPPDPNPADFLRIRVDAQPNRKDAETQRVRIAVVVGAPEEDETPTPPQYVYATYTEIVDGEEVVRRIPLVRQLLMTAPHQQTTAENPKPERKAKRVTWKLRTDQRFSIPSYVTQMTISAIFFDGTVMEQTVEVVTS